MTKQDRINKWEVKIGKIVLHYKKLTASCDACFDAGVLDVDGNLYTAIWTMFDNMLDMIDHNDWISWYVFENDCGVMKMEAGHNGKLSKITTPKQLAKLIVDGENCNTNQPTQ